MFDVFSTGAIRGREHLPPKPRLQLRRSWPRVLLALAGFLAVTGVQAQDCDPAPSGLISWWPGDTNANDIAGANNGTLHGGATAGNPGVVGGAFLFDGTNGYCSIPDAPSLHPTNLTVEAWVRCDLLNAATNGGYPGLQYVIFHQNTNMFNFEGFALAKDRRPMFTGTNDTWAFSVSSTNGTNIYVESLVHVQTNLWYHLAGVRGSNFIQLYVNGILQGQTNVTFPQGYGPYPLYFADTGQSYYDPKFAGALDEVALYNRALSSNEIYAIYAAGHAGKCKTPTALSVALTQPPPGSSQVTIAGLTGQVYGIQATTLPLVASNTWVGLTNQTLSASTNVWTDPLPATNAQKFYRALPGPISVP
jgi:hypothetical protein